MSSKSSRSHSIDRRAFLNSVVVQSNSSRAIGILPATVGVTVLTSCSSVQRPYKPRFLFKALHTSLEIKMPSKKKLFSFELANFECNLHSYNLNQTN